MKVRYTPTAARNIEDQIGYLVERGAEPAARRLAERLAAFIEGFLVTYPKTGRFIPEHALFESWVPKTRLIVFYRLEAPDTLRVLAVLHAAQDRTQLPEM